MYEHIIGSIFKLKMINFSGHDISLFKRFQLAWENIDPQDLQLIQKTIYHIIKFNGRQ